MSYDIIDPDAIESRPDIPGDHRYVQDATDLNHLSMQFIQASPGESFVPYHYHEEQEEVFYVLSGKLHVRTPDREYVVAAGQVFVTQPGNPLQPYVPESAESGVGAIILNAPQTDDFRSYDPDE